MDSSLRWILPKRISDRNVLNVVVFFQLYHVLIHVFLSVKVLIWFCVLERFIQENRFLSADICKTPLTCKIWSNILWGCTNAAFLLLILEFGVDIDTWCQQTTQDFIESVHVILDKRFSFVKQKRYNTEQSWRDSFALTASVTWHAAYIHTEARWPMYSISLNPNYNDNFNMKYLTVNAVWIWDSISQIQI